MRRRLLPLAVAAVLLVFAGLRARAGIERLEASSLVWQAQGLVASARTGHPGARRALGRGLRLLRRAEALDPWNPGLLTTRGTIHLLLGRTDAAAADYEEALDLEPRAEIYFDLAIARRTAGRHGEARELLEKAVRLAPAFRDRVDRLLNEGRDAPGGVAEPESRGGEGIDQGRIFSQGFEGGDLRGWDSVEGPDGSRPAVTPPGR